MDWLQLGIEMGILGFFALLYYLIQRRRITHYHHDEVVEQYALWIYDYHHFLDSIKGQPEYEILNAFVTDIESVDLQLANERAQLIQKIPSPMPSELRERLCRILSI